MASYSDERKEAVLKNLLPPLNMTVAEVARQEDIGLQTLYNWRDKAKKLGLPVPGKKPTSEQWSAETKLAVIIETSAMTEAELGEYCRAKGLYSEQIKHWKESCLAGFQVSKEQEKAAAKQSKADKRKLNEGQPYNLTNKQNALVNIGPPPLPETSKKFSKIQSFSDVSDE